MLSVGLIGFGKAGKAVANVILQHPDFTLEFVLRKSDKQEHQAVREFIGVETDDPALIYSIEHVQMEAFLEEHPVDFIIDFSSQDGIYFYGENAAERHIKLISAISHYNKETIRFLKQLAKKTVVLWSPNITVGVNFLMLAANILRKIAPWADIEIVEEHFKLKNGVSGTALKMADQLQLDSNQINSIRVGGIVGRHEVIFGFPYQTVRLIHESISREAFGNGALFAASHLLDKQTGYYTFEDILLPYFKG
jgi:4-hydroxy-tetrahydrodipicolinate reductase